MNGIEYESKREELQNQGKELHAKYLQIKALVSKKADEILLNNVGIKIFEEFYDFLNLFKKTINEHRNNIDVILKEVGINFDEKSKSSVILDEESRKLIKDNTGLHFETAIRKIEKEIDELFEYLLKLSHQSYTAELINPKLNDELEILGYFLNGLPEANYCGFIQSVQFQVKCLDKNQGHIDNSKNHELHGLINFFKGKKIPDYSLINFINKTIEYLDTYFIENNSELFENLKKLLEKTLELINNISILKVQEELPENGDIKLISENIASIIVDKLDDKHKDIFGKK